MKDFFLLLQVSDLDQRLPEFALELSRLWRPGVVRGGSKDNFCWRFMGALSPMLWAGNLVAYFTGKTREQTF